MYIGTALQPVLSPASQPTPFPVLISSSKLQTPNTIHPIPRQEDEAGKRKRKNVSQMIKALLPSTKPSVNFVTAAQVGMNLAETPLAHALLE